MQPHTIKKIKFGLLILLFAFFQSAILDYIKIFDAKPDLLLIAVFVSGISFNMFWASFFGIFSGILKDALVINSFGINTLIFAISGFLISRLSRKVSFENKFVCMAFIFIATIANSVIIKLFFSFIGKPMPLTLNAFLRIAFFESLYNAISLLLLLRFLK